MGKEHYRFFLKKDELLGWIVEVYSCNSVGNSFVLEKWNAENEILSSEEDFVISSLLKKCYSFKFTSIYNKFGKAFSNLQLFKNNLDNDTVEYKVRPYLCENLSAFLSICKSNNIELYLVDKNSELQFQKPLKISSSVVDIDFYLNRNDEGLVYFLKGKVNQREFQFSSLKVELLCLKPCWLLIENEVYECNSSIDGKKIIPFLTKNEIFVPKKIEEQFLKQFLIHVVKEFQIITSGFEIEYLYLKPIMQWSLETDWKNEAVIGISFLYGNVKFLSHDNRKTKVQLNESSGKYSFYKIERDITLEQEQINQLLDVNIRHKEGCNYSIERCLEITDLISWLNFNTSFLKANNIQLVSNYFTNRFYTGFIHVKENQNKAIDWFDLDISIEIEDYSFPLVFFKQHIIENKPTFLLPDNKLLVLPKTWFSQYKDLLLFGDIQDNKIKIKRKYLGLIYGNNEKTRNIDELGLKYIDANEFSIPSLPKGLKIRLREYQKIGFYWLCWLNQQKFGGCLTDDMGLGKTIQVITLLQHLHEQNYYSQRMPVKAALTNRQLDLFTDFCDEVQYNDVAPSLIVAPLSVIDNWHKEFIKCSTITNIYKHLGAKRLTSASQLVHYEIILTSYQTLVNDFDLLFSVSFNYLIADESQFIKNAETKAFQCLSQLKAQHRIALTGTPIENSLKDLWAQMNFVNPNLLGSIEFFNENFVYPIEKLQCEEKVNSLKTIISPFYLRRTKEMVLKELPPLCEMNCECVMSDDQADLYQHKLASIRNFLLTKQENNNSNQLTFFFLKALLQLRQIANHPRLIDKEYCGESGKYQQLLERINMLIAENHKILIFSQFVTQLNLLSEYLSNSNIQFSILTGKLNAEKRRNAIDKFNNDDKCQIFLISLKAGGVGLNLPKANYVFLLDPWWNPAVEKQAIDRAYRIGQNNSVFVYRFITKCTVEEKIQQLQLRKTHLSKLIIDSNNPMSKLNLSDFNYLLDLY